MRLFEDAQLTLPGFEHCPSRALLGFQGEIKAQEMLERRGYRVEHAFRQMGDLRAIDPTTGVITKIEVKTAQRGKDGKWRATLRKCGCTDYRYSDVVLLLVVTEGYLLVPYLIPVAHLNQPHICITSHPNRYRGKFAKYRQQWESFSLEIEQ